MTAVITSLQNQIVKLAAGLKQRKNRDATGLFAAEGIRLLETALAAGWQSEYCLYTEQALANRRAQAVIDLLKEQNCRMITVSEAVYAKISDTEQPQGIMVLIRKQTPELPEVLKEKCPLLVILDSVQDPGNLGAVIRTADAAGATAVILTKGCTDLYAGKAVRATMGSLFHLPVVAGVDHETLTEILRSNDITLMASSLNSANSYWETDFTSPSAIVFGNEGQGVSQTLLDTAASRIYIPILGSAESLNVAAAAAVILYEAARQRRLG